MSKTVLAFFLFVLVPFCGTAQNIICNPGFESPKIQNQFPNDLAQEAQEIIPEIVHYNANGDYFGISYTSLIPILIKAIQEQQVRIEYLESQLK